MEHAGEVSEAKGSGIGRALAEVYQILIHTSSSLQILIPRKFWRFLHDNMDSAWRGNLDFSKNLNDMDLLEDTRTILALVYRDFLCSSEERKAQIKKDKWEAIVEGWEYEYHSLMDIFGS